MELITPERVTGQSHEHTRAGLSLCLDDRGQRGDTQVSSQPDSGSHIPKRVAVMRLSL